MPFETREIRLFGNFAILDDGQLSPLLSNAKGCALLVYLIVNGMPVKRQYLADLLWDAVTTKQALGSLRRTLHKMRPLVPSLHITRDYVSYQPDELTKIDLINLKRVIMSEDIEEIITLNRGDFLADFYLDSSPRYMEWVRSQQVVWQTNIHTTFERIFYHATTQEDWSTASNIARRWFILSPYNEIVLRHLMTSLAHNGNMTEAQLVFDTYANRLLREEHTQPEPETLALHEQIF